MEQKIKHDLTSKAYWLAQALRSHAATMNEGASLAPEGSNLAALFREQEAESERLACILEQCEEDGLELLLVRHT